MLQLPHHQDLNMPPNFPMSNDSGFHETGKVECGYGVHIQTQSPKKGSHVKYKQ